MLNERSECKSKRKTDTDRRERLISKLYVCQSIRVLDQRETRSVKIGRGVTQDAVCHQFYSNYTANTLLTKPLKG